MPRSQLQVCPGQGNPIRQHHCSNECELDYSRRNRDQQVLVSLGLSTEYDHSEPGPSPGTGPGLRLRSSARDAAPPGAYLLTGGAGGTVTLRVVS